MYFLGMGVDNEEVKEGGNMLVFNVCGFLSLVYSVIVEKILFVFDGEYVVLSFRFLVWVLLCVVYILICWEIW